MSYSTCSEPLRHPLSCLRTAVVLTGAVLIYTALASAVRAEAEEPPPKEPPPEAQRFDSGLATLRLSPGHTDAHPDGNDYVAFHFTIWTADGVKFQSSYDTGQPRNYLMDRISPAWRQGLELMAVGEKRRLWIPQHLAPKGKKEAPAQPVICDLELFAFRSIPNLSPDDLRPPADATRTAHGAFTQVLEPGTGTETAGSGVGALAHFTLWTQNGRVFDSTVIRNRATFFQYDRVMPAFVDAIRTMRVGETRRIWIPAQVADGNWSGSPKGALIFQVQLLRVTDKNLFSDAQATPGQSG